MQNNPMFASASGNNHDEFDLGEVFAEYFSNEFDSDPLNAYTSSMANYNNPAGGLPSAAAAHAAALQQANNMQYQQQNQQQQQQNGGSGDYSLPTGGIKTAFHGIGTSSRPAPPIAQPPQKRVKSEESPASVPSNTSTTINNMFGNPLGALAMAHQQAATAAAATAASQQNNFVAQLASTGGIPHQQLLQAAAAAVVVNPSVIPSSSSNGDHHPGARVALPVGVGIRLGGLGGIAPATAAGQARPPVMQAQQYAALFGGFVGGAGVGAGGMMVPGQVQEVAVAERRQRNREHAKRSRVRKKFMLESMQEQVRSLQIENQNLRLLVQEHIPEHATSIIAECCPTSPIFSDRLVGLGLDDDDSSAGGAPPKLGKTDFNLMESLAAGQRCFVLSDPKLPDNPIVFASGDFYKLTGYTPKEVLGRNCRFLQGPGTDPRAVEVIRKAITTGADATVCLLNYKADGTPFWNQFFIAALRDSDNCIVNYVGVQCEVEPEQGDSTVEEKVNEVLPLQNKHDDDSE